MEIRDADPFASSAERAQARDDPFAREGRVPDDDADAVSAEIDRTVSLVGPLAQRDPRSAIDDSVEFHLTGEVSFDDLLRRARRRGFLAGCAAGALAAVVLVAIALSSGEAGPAVVAPEQRTDAPSRAAVASLAGAPAGADAAPPAKAATAAPAKAVAAPAASAATVPPATRRTGAPAGPSSGPAPDVDPGAANDAVPADRGAGAGEATGLDLRSPERPAATPAAREASGIDPTGGPGSDEAAAPRRTLDDGEVADALALRRDAIDACVAATAADDPTVAGRRYLLVLAIDPDGRVSDARIDDPAIYATPLGACLVRIAREMSFEPFDGEPVQVELPLRHASAE